MKNNKRPFLFKPRHDETIEEFKLRLKALLKVELVETTKKSSAPRNIQTVTNTYTLAHLVTHPSTKHIIYKHLKPLYPYADDLKHLEYIDCTLDGLADNNMGGGIPYEVMIALMEELNTSELLRILSGE